MPSGSLPDINFKDIRPSGEPASRPGGFEELASVLVQQGAVEWPDDVRFERFGNPDGGRDGRGILPNGDVWAWQVKYLHRFDEDAADQVRGSVLKALDCEPRLRRYFVVFPIDLPAGADKANRISAHERWRRASERLTAEARTKGMNVEFVFVGAHELLTALTSPRHAWRIRYWFGEHSPDEALTGYLRRLVEVLDADPWPTRFSGPVLAPSQIERKLVVSGGHGPGHEDADDLCGRCSRLVIIGDSGTGKTWLARRAARRCAEAALDKLRSGVPVDEIELPLFTTCARLAAAEGDSIRDVIVRSALDQLGDLGSGCPDAAVRALLAERDGPTLVVLDSLDEAAGRDDRVRRADTLTGWRVILTSRPSSWDGQLNVTSGDPSRQVGTLVPLRYPGDVEPFIARWFKDRPEWGDNLTAQIRGRQELQKAATVPLILAFYCIIGGQDPLPARTPELYDKVINRMLTGHWRGSSQLAPYDVEARLAVLRSWAWQAAASDPFSGVGRWEDEITPERVPDDPAVRAALDHVAFPLGPPDPDTGRIARRFAHRSIQEHLVARHVASLPAGQAAEELVGHLWYDEDWAPYALPVAIALHHDREKLLSLLAQRVTGSTDLPGEILALDGRHQVSALLARLAEHTDEADWSPGAAALILQAMRRIHGEDDFAWVPGGWPSFSEPLVRAATRFLEADHPQAQRLDQITSGPLLALVGRERVLGAVLRALALATHRDAGELAWLVPRLNPSATERAEARDQVKRVLSETCCRYYPGRLSWQGGRVRRLAWKASLAHTLAELADSVEERAQAADDLVALLGRCTETREDEFIGAIGSLDPSAALRETAGGILLARLPPDRTWSDVAHVAGAIASLCQAPAQRAAALQALTESVVSADAHVMDMESPQRIANIAELITDLAGDDHNLGRARSILAAEASREAASGKPRKASALACLTAELNPADGELALLEEALLAAIGAQATAEPALHLAEAGLVIAQDPVRQDLFRQKALEVAINRCAASQHVRLGWDHDGRLKWERIFGNWERIFGNLLYYADTPGEQARCLDLILQVLARQDISDVAPSREFLASLAGIEGALQRVQAVLLERLDDANDLLTVIRIAWALQSPALEDETRKRVRAALVSKLDDDDTDSVRLDDMTWSLIGDLSTTEAEKAEARTMLLKISCETGEDFHWEDSLTEDGLRSLTADIDALQIQPCHLTDGMLTAIRYASPLDAWLTALPRLSAPQQPAPHARRGAGGGRPWGPPRPACPLGLGKPGQGNGLSREKAPSRL